MKVEILMFDWFVYDKIANKTIVENPCDWNPIKQNVFSSCMDTGFVEHRRMGLGKHIHMHIQVVSEDKL